LNKIIVIPIKDILLTKIIIYISFQIIMLKLYNTLSRTKEEFKPIKKGQAGMYCCGPTVYWYQHIGNLRTYIFEDILKRVLQYNGYNVKHVINVTDVGHLTSDADTGEDKLVKALKRENMPLTEESMFILADKYFQVFRDDFKKLHILPPDVWCKATEHINDMIELIKRIEENGYAYKTSVGLTYDTSKFSKYAELGRLNLDQLEEGKRGEKDKERRNSSDFALWITNQPNHIMQWDSPWGKGFPGWDIECSAMSMKHLGEQIDIHCGGKEHIPKHHTNEIAQVESATGKKWVNFWLHAEWLELSEGKMSKSKGEFITVNDLIKKGYDPIVYRYFCFTAHYRSPLTFSWNALDSAKNGYENLKQRVIEIKQDLSGSPTDHKYKDEFYNFLNDDLDMPRALSVVWNTIKDQKLGNKEKYNLLLEFDKILGFGMDKWEKEEIKLDPEIDKMVQERETARKNKDYKKADEIRAKLLDKGIVLEDTPEGVRWKKR